MARPSAAELEDLRRDAERRWGWLCALCRFRGQLELHHRKTRRRGGPDSIENLLPVCRGCHNRIHHHPEAAERAGLLIASWAPAPSEIWDRLNLSGFHADLSHANIARSTREERPFP